MDCQELQDLQEIQGVVYCCTSLSIILHTPNFLAFLAFLKKPQFHRLKKEHMYYLGAKLLQLVPLKILQFLQNLAKRDQKLQDFQEKYITYLFYQTSLSYICRTPEDGGRNLHPWQRVGV